MKSTLQVRVALRLLPLVAMLAAVFGNGSLVATGAPRAGDIKAERWTETRAAQAPGMRQAPVGKYVMQTYTSGVRSTAFKFNAVAASWNIKLSKGDTVRILLRSSSDGKRWSAWRSIEADSDDGMQPGENFGNLQVVSGRLAQFRLELISPKGKPLPVMYSMQFTFINSEDGPGLGDLSARSGVAYAAESAPRVVSRAQWGAAESLRYDSNGRETWPREYSAPKKVILHDTATINNDPNPPATVRAIYYYHAVVRNWGDIGYNYLVDEQGNIYQGRAGGTNVVGGHARCYNWGTVGIAALGDHSTVAPSAAMMRSIENLTAWVMDSNKIDPMGSGVLGSYAPYNLPNLATHSDLMGSCGNTHRDPGILLRQQLPEMRRSLAKRIGSRVAGTTGTGTPTPRTPAPPTPPTVPPASTTGAGPGSPGEPSYVVTNTQKWGMNLREKPSMSSRVLTVVPEGTVVHELTSPPDGWVKTTYNGKTGYLWYQGYLKEVAADAPAGSGGGGAGPSLSAGRTAVIKGTPGALNLRSRPAMESRAVVRMWEGMKVKITGAPRGGWYPVTYRDGYGREYTGWAWGEYLRPTSSRTAGAFGVMALAGVLAVPVWRKKRRSRAAGA